MYFYILLGLFIICITFLITLCIKSCHDHDKNIQKYNELNLITFKKLNGKGYKIFSLKTLIKYVSECKVKNKLLNLDFIPAYSNYFFEIYSNDSSYIVQVNNNFEPSQTSFKRHLELDNINDYCYIMLSPKQLEYLDLIKKKDVDVQTNKND